MTKFFCLFLLAAFSVQASAGNSAFSLFESGHVRPMALDDSGAYLYVVNTPENRVEVYATSANGLRHKASVPVGLEPVALAIKNKKELWVVNHLSDSISIVDIQSHQKLRVTRTLNVGDEPRDIVFAGPNRSRAFITTAHRGQNHPNDAQLTTPGVPRADVWVFEDDPEPLEILSLFGDTPRALAVSPDGRRVYAAVFLSGNKTTSLFFPGLLLNPFSLPGPLTNVDGFEVPARSLIVQHNGTNWVDDEGNNRDGLIAFNLPDYDVFTIDAMSDPPVNLEDQTYAGVGTVLFNMAVNPVSGKVYVSNTEANNLERFEGPGIFAGKSLRGKLHQSRITVLSSDGVQPRHLNKHIDYDQCCDPIPNPVNQKSLAIPNQMALSPDGSTLYLAAMGSSKIGVFSTKALEDDSFIPDEKHHISLTGGGPTGLVLDEKRGRLYSLTRFDHGISTIDLATRKEIDHVLIGDSEPESVKVGRRFLYDAAYSSSNGESSCASCHVFGDDDGLAWDLGNPDGAMLENPGPFVSDPAKALELDFHPMKGPMVTQSLRGMANHGPMHWRGDRFSTESGPNQQPDGGVFDEKGAFKTFNQAFVDLLGRHEPLPDEDMNAFTEFILQVMHPPNPIRNLNNALNEVQQKGRDAFFGPTPTFFGENCTGCHSLDPNGNPDSDFPGFFGTEGLQSFNGGAQMLKAAHLRSLYEKVGMFGMVTDDIVPIVFPDTTTDHTGDQIRGYGFFHDGTVDTLFRFNSHIEFFNTVDNPNPLPSGEEGIRMREQVVEFLFVFPTNHAPIVGQQETIESAAPNDRVTLFLERENAGECDVVVHGSVKDQPRSFLFKNQGYVSDVPYDKIGHQELMHYASPDYPLTFTCVPKGSGERIAFSKQ